MSPCVGCVCYIHHDDDQPLEGVWWKRESGGGSKKGTYHKVSS